jgi:antitoxin YefM
MKTRTYSQARESLAELWDDIEDTRDEVILQRRGHEDLALLPADELRALQETAHLLRSPTNALRLLRALERSRRGSRTEAFGSTSDLAAELGLDVE